MANANTVETALGSPNIQVIEIVQSPSTGISMWHVDFLPIG
jgi:hypothetical protein